MITTIGVAFILINVMLLAWGPQTQRFPQLLPNWRWEVVRVEITFKQLVLFAVALVLMLALWHLVRRTTLGKAMRATAQDADAARMMGIDVDRVVVLTFFLGSALAGAGSLFFGLYYGFTGYYIGYTIGLRAFTSAGADAEATSRQHRTATEELARQHDRPMHYLASAHTP